MTWTVSASGAATTVPSTVEVTLATDTTNGTYVLEVDTSNMTLGDLLSIRVYTATVTTTGQAWMGTYQHAQASNHKLSPPIASDVSIKCSLTMPAGGSRTYEWKLLRI